MLRTTAVVAGWLVLVGTAQAAVQNKTVVYRHGELECRGYLAWDDSVKGPRPGVLVLHEWWGLNDYARGRADELAKLGYVAFAADIYGGGKVTEHPQEAGDMATKVRANVADWRKRAEEALGVLAAQPQCDKTRLAAIGYCFGGSTALQLAYAGADLKAVGTFHAALPEPKADDAKRIRAAILVCHGADDKFIPDQAIKSFRQRLDAAGVKYEFVSYPNTVHSFTVPNADKHNIAGMKYNKSADEDSWKRLVSLLADKFKG